MVGHTVAAILRVAAADQAELVQLLGQLRQMLAELDPRQLRVNDLEFAANLCRCIRLRVEGVNVAGASLHPHKNAVYPLAVDRRVLCLGLQELRQTERQASQAADLQELTAGHSFAMGRDGTGELQHE